MKKLLFVSFVFFSFLNKNNLFGQVPSLIKDIYVGINGSNSAFNGVAYNNGVIFTANNGINGSEIWYSDGSVAGTTMVKDINPGTSGSVAGGYFTYNTKLLFGALDGNGAELWITDGTLAGTNMVKDINPGGASSNPTNLTYFGSNVMFVASTAAEGGELWLTNGSGAGTNLVKDIWPGPATSTIVQITNSGLGYVYFVANDGTTGEELWKSDGTPGGTVLVKDIKPGTGFSNCQIIKMAGGLLFFLADDGINGKELWRSDGTTAGTFMTKDIIPGSNSTFTVIPANIVYNNKLVFVATDLINGAELWESDGTNAGTIVNNITPGINGTDFNSNFYNFGNDMFFFRQQTLGAKDTMLYYRVSNSVSNCNLIKKFSSATSSGLKFYVSLIQTNLSKFVGVPANCGVIGTSSSDYFFVSDGTALGSSLVTPNAACFYYPVTSIPFINNKWIYPVSTATAGIDYEFCNIDYSTGAVSLIKNINPGKSFNDQIPSFGLSWFYKTYLFNNKYFFLANDGTTGDELYATDGTIGGTNLLLDIYTGGFNGPVSGLGNFNAVVTSNNIFFYANNGTTGNELWALLLVTSIKENQNKLFENVFLFPNPVNETINFNLSSEYFKEVKVDYVIYNSLGQECGKGRLSENKINISGITDGFYNISLKTPEKTTVLKFIKD